MIKKLELFNRIFHYAVKTLLVVLILLEIHLQMDFSIAAFSFAATKMIMVITITIISVSVFLFLCDNTMQQKAKKTEIGSILLLFPVDYCNCCVVKVCTQQLFKYYCNE